MTYSDDQKADMRAAGAAAAEQAKAGLLDAFGSDDVIAGVESLFGAVRVLCVALLDAGVAPNALMSAVLAPVADIVVEVRTEATRG